MNNSALVVTLERAARIRRLLRRERNRPQKALRLLRLNAVYLALQRRLQVMLASSSVSRPDLMAGLPAHTRLQVGR
jgi:hypothetical protein